MSDPTNEQNYNRYTYVLNNPTNLTDPTGFAAATDAIYAAQGGTTVYQAESSPPEGKSDLLEKVRSAIESGTPVVITNGGNVVAVISPGQTKGTVEVAQDGAVSQVTDASGKTTSAIGRLPNHLSGLNLTKDRYLEAARNGLWNRVQGDPTSGYTDDDTTQKVADSKIP